MAMKTWKVQPYQLTVIEILKKKGSLSDVELLEALKSFYKNIGYADLNKTLMKMEVTRLIFVSSLTKGKRLVQLVPKKSENFCFYFRCHTFGMSAAAALYAITIQGIDSGRN